MCVTAQHREMLDDVLRLFEIVPDVDLNIMTKTQSLTDITTRVLTGMEPVLAEHRPDVVLVHGDTTTSTATALAAFYAKIPVGHVEAGLRTATIDEPFPEELNRRLTGVIASYHFAPTAGAKANLLAERIDDAEVIVTGNTVIDAFLDTTRLLAGRPPPAALARARPGPPADLRHRPPAREPRRDAGHRAAPSRRSRPSRSVRRSSGRSTPRPRSVR